MESFLPQRWRKVWKVETLKKGKVEAAGDSLYREVGGDGSAKSECHKPNTGIRCAMRAERLPDSNSPGGTIPRVTYSGENAPTAVSDATIPTIWKVVVNAKCSEYTRTVFSKYLIHHRKRVEGKAERCNISGGLKPFRGQDGDEIVQVAMEDSGMWRFCQGNTKMGVETVFYRRVFREHQAVCCSMLNKPELATRELLRWRVESAKITLYNVE